MFSELFLIFFYFLFSLIFFKNVCYNCIEWKMEKIDIYNISAKTGDFKYYIKSKNLCVTYNCKIKWFLFFFQSNNQYSLLHLLYFNLHLVILMYWQNILADFSWPSVLFSQDFKSQTVIYFIADVCLKLSQEWKKESTFCLFLTFKWDIAWGNLFCFHIHLYFLEVLPCHCLWGSA